MKQVKAKEIYLLKWTKWTYFLCPDLKLKKTAGNVQQRNTGVCQGCSGFVVRADIQRQSLSAPEILKLSGVDLMANVVLSHYGQSRYLIIMHLG